MPKAIAHAATTEVKIRDGSLLVVQEWPFLVAAEALDAISDAFDNLKDQGVIDSLLDVKLDLTNAVDTEGNLTGEEITVKRSSQIEQFANAIKAFKEYRPKFLELLCSAVVTKEGKTDLTPADMKNWFIDELFDLCQAVWKVNFIEGSLKKVKDKWTEQRRVTKPMTSPQTSEAESSPSSEATTLGSR